MTATTARVTKAERSVLAMLGGNVRLVDYCDERAQTYLLTWPNGTTKPVKPATVAALVRKGLLVRSGWHYVHTDAGITAVRWAA